MRLSFNTFVVIILIISLTSCVSKKFENGDYQFFQGKSKWTEQEQLCCLKAIKNIANADSTKIIFKKSRIKSMGQAQPHPLTIFRNSNKRVSIISVRDISKNKKLCFSTIPDSAKIGLIAHELTHVMDFQSKDFFKLMAMSYKYSLSSKFRKDTEWKTDSLSIINGLGQEVLCFYDYIINSPFISEKYLQNKKKFYMHREDIIRIMESMEN